MHCPYCNAADTRVIDSRESQDFTIRRRRECDKCHNRFTTYEKIERKPILVIKKDGGRESFDRNKIYKGVLSSCIKRPVSSTDIEKLLDSIEKELIQKEVSEIKSIEIGEMVLKKLKKLDKIAYIRFASVYKEFKEVQNFGDEVAKIIKK